MDVTALPTAAPGWFHWSRFAGFVSIGGSIELLRLSDLNNPTLSQFFPEFPMISHFSITFSPVFPFFPAFSHNFPQFPVSSRYFPLAAPSTSARRHLSEAIGTHRHQKRLSLKSSPFAPPASLGGTVERRPSISPAYQGLSRDFK